MKCKRGRDLRSGGLDSDRTETVPNPATTRITFEINKRDGKEGGGGGGSFVANDIHPR